MKKYTFTGETREYLDKTLKRVVRIEDNLVGGWIESEHNLSHDGNCFVFDNAIVMDDARVIDNAIVKDFGVIMNNGLVKDNGVVKDCGLVKDNGVVKDYCIVKGNALILNNMVVSKGDIISDNNILYCDNNYNNINNDMKIYQLDMTKSRWEISLLDDKLNAKCFNVYENAEAVYIHNNNIYISANKTKLIKIAHNLLEEKINKMRFELDYYENMKFKITKK